MSRYSRPPRHGTQRNTLGKSPLKIGPGLRERSLPPLQYKQPFPGAEDNLASDEKYNYDVKHEGAGGRTDWEYTISDKKGNVVDGGSGSSREAVVRKVDAFRKRQRS